MRNIYNKFLISAKIKSELLKIAESSSTREAITKAQLEDFKIPLLPLSEQQKIVVKIGKIEQEIATNEATIQVIPQQKEAVLKKYL